MRTQQSPAADHGGADEIAPGGELSAAIVPPASQRDADVARVTPKTPAERQRAHRERERQKKRDALTAALVTPATVTPVTPEVPITPVVPAVGLTKAERDDLVKISRERGRVAKARIESVKAELVADVEKKLSETFSYRDEMWRDGIEVAEQAVADANAQIQRVLEDRGVPAEFRPSVELAWSSRGQNADKSRRAELRKLAGSMISIDFNHFHARVLQDCLTEATAQYWVHRAHQFQQAAPRLEEFHGNATVEELREAWYRCMDTSQACLRHADIVRGNHPEPIGDEVTSVLEVT